MKMETIENKCIRCDVARDDYNVDQWQGQWVIGELCTSSATSHQVMKSIKKIEERISTHSWFKCLSYNM